MDKGSGGGRGRADSNAGTSTASKRLTLRDALHFFGDAEQIAEMLHLEATGHSGPQLIILGGAPSESERKQSRYRQLRQNAENSLRMKLVKGEIIATGRDSRDKIDGPRIKVPPERWQTFAFDFENSTASGDGLLITHILMAEEGGLQLWEASRRARLGTVELKLSPQSHGLLLALAKAALAGPAPLGVSELKAQFFNARTDEKALGQGMGTLRKQLVNSGLDKELVGRLIVPFRGVGYALGIGSAEISIDP